MAEEHAHRFEYIERNQELLQNRVRELEMELQSHLAATRETNGHLQQGLEELKTEVGKTNGYVQELYKKESRQEGSREGSYFTLKLVFGIFAVVSALANIYFIITEVIGN